MCSSSRQRTMARLPSFGMMKESEDWFTFRPCSEIAYFAHMSMEHAPEPVIGRGGDEIGHDAELGAAERRRDRVAAERNRVVGCHVLFVAGRHVVGDEDDVDIGLSDEESLHCLSVMRLVVPAGGLTLTPVPCPGR